jgi:tyrosine-protein kinase Etk/Wzc
MAKKDRETFLLGSRNAQATEQDIGGSERIYLLDLFLVVWRRKIIVIAATFIFAIGTLIFALIMVPTYSAQTTIMPISTGSNTSVSQYASLAVAAGISIPAGGVTNPTQKIIAILNSRTLGERVVTEMNLVPVILGDTSEMTKRTPLNVAVEAFRKNILLITSDDITGIISISVHFKDQNLTYLTANKVAEILESILNEKNLALSKKSNDVLKEQIDDQRKKVDDLQQKMAKFQKDTKIITPEGQVTSAMGLYSVLLDKKLTLEVNLSTLENTLSADNPKISSIMSQLDTINSQIMDIESKTGVGSFSIGSAPEQIVEYENISRDLEIASKLYSSLLATYENQKLQEVQNLLLVEVIDPAIFPEVKSKPSRAIICIIGTMVGFLLGIAAVFAIDVVKRIKTEIFSRNMFA